MHPAFRQALNWEIDAQRQQQQAFYRTPLVELLDDRQAAGPFEAKYASEQRALILSPHPGADISLIKEGDRAFVLNPDGEPWRNERGAIIVGEVDEVTNVIKVLKVHAINPQPTIFLVKNGSCMTGCLESIRKQDIDWPSLSYSQPVLVAQAEIPTKYIIQLNEAGIRAFRAAAALNDLIALKGPPGTGKSQLIGFLCNFLVHERKLRIMLASKTNNAVDEVMGCVHQAQAQLGTNVPLYRWLSKRRSQKYTQTAMHTWAPAWNPKKDKETLKSGCVVGVTIDTAYSAPTDITFDLIILDEAGQIPMFQVAGLARLAPRFLFSGDDEQLPPILTAEHIQESSDEDKHKGAQDPSLSGLMWLAKYRGPEWVFLLDKTHRLTKENCAATGEIFYQDKLKPGANQDSCVHGLNGTLFKVEAGDLNRLNTNPAEVEAIARLVERLLNKEATWDGQQHKITPQDIAVLVPYRMQADLLLERMKALGVTKIGTVDIMQGQSTAVMIFGMTTTDIRTMGERIEWLFLGNRWNVASSRAKCATFLVGRFSLLPQIRSSTLKGIQFLQRVSQLVAKFKPIQLESNW